MACWLHDRAASSLNYAPDCMLMVSAFHVFDFHSYFYGRQLLNSHSVADAKSSKIGIATKGMMSQRYLDTILGFCNFYYAELLLFPSVSFQYLQNVVKLYYFSFLILEFDANYAMPLQV